VFDVSSEMVGNREYFKAIVDEMDNGGREAMLHDLLNVKLGDWHPRHSVPQTAALRDQKMLSLSADDELWLILLQEGMLPQAYERNARAAPSRALVEYARKAVPRGLGNASDYRIIDGLKERGCRQKFLKNIGRGWEFPALKEARAEWDKKFGAHDWGEQDDWALM
jgi:hypothetical protein